MPLYSFEERDRIKDELHAQTDRGAAIIGAAYLEVGLAQLLLACFVTSKKTIDEKTGKPFWHALFRDPNAPLASFSAKIRLASALGLIGDHTEADLNRIREIRNRFAHEFFDELSFAEQSTRDRCNALWWPKNVYNVYAKDPPTELIPFPRGKVPTAPRYLYIATVVLLTNLMFGRQLGLILNEDYKGLIERSALKAPLLP